MNTPNPLVPQGSLQQQNKGKSNLRIAVFTIVAIHVVVLGGLLMQGCGDKTAKNSGAQNTNAGGIDTFPPLTNAMDTAVNTNLVTPIQSTNVAVVAPTNPPVVPEPAPTVVADGRTYVVGKGDFLASIAKKNGVSLKALEAANPGVVPTKLKIGQKLQIPGGGASVTADATTHVSASGGETKMYTVKPGDNLTKIARANGAKTSEIKKLNDLKTDQIKVGQKLKLPQRASAEAAPATAPAPSNGGVVASTNAIR